MSKETVTISKELFDRMRKFISDNETGVCWGIDADEEQEEYNNYEAIEINEAIKKELGE